MRLLLDTHTIVWWFLASPRLSDAAREALSLPAALLHVSAASAWEMATKERAGRWPEVGPVAVALDDLLMKHQLVALPVTIAHGRRAGQFDGDHRDPFDRMLAAQAELDELTLVTADPVFARFPVKTLW